MRSIVVFLAVISLQSAAQTGPGGVGNSASNFLFLKADAGTSTTVDGNAVSTWNDQSGNLTHATQAVGANQPIYKTAQLNGFPSIRFNGTSHFFACPSVFPTNADYTKIVVGKVSSTATSNNFFSGITQHAFWLQGGSLAPKLYQQGTFVTSSINVVLNQFSVLSGTFKTSARLGEIFVNSTSGGTGTAGSANTDAAIQIGAAAGGSLLSGDLTEVIGYNFALNSAQRVIVENYLSAKYALTLTSNDLYVQDNPANGNYDFDVAGIGRVNASNIHNDAQGAGFIRILNPTDLEDNEFFIWGRDNGTPQATNTADVPAGLNARFARIWRVSEVGGDGDVGNVDVQVDVTGLADFSSLSACDAAGVIRLLVDTNNDGLFADQIAITGATNVGGNVYRFANVSALANNTRFTIAIVNSANGPGGVGNSASNFLFLKADAGTSTTINNASVSTWADQSGNVNNAIQATAGNQPTFKIAQLNGLPSINFNGTSNFMACPSSFPTNTDYTKFVIAKSTDFSASNNFFSGSSVHAFFMGGAAGPRIYHAGSTVNSSINMALNQFAVLSTTFTNSSLLGNVFLNGAIGGTGTLSGVNTDNTIQIGSFASSNFLVGDIAEVVGYNLLLNTAQRVIVENYLSAKYNIALSANDVYTRDNSANGNFDFEVAGIGRVDASNQHLNAKGTGLVRVSDPTDLGNGEYFMWGHNNGSLAATNTTDVPAGIQVRMNRVWSISELAGDVGSLTMQFDLTGLGSVTASDLRLLVDNDGDGIFNEVGTVLISGATAISCNNYLFSSVSALNDGMRFTIGSTNLSQTPLPITLLSFTGKMANGKALFTWTTTTEQNNEYFVVERSTDGETFKPIGSTISATGNGIIRNNYQTTDQSPPFGKVFYRLKQVDMDEDYSYSKIIALQNSSLELNMQLMPNPVQQGGEMNVKISLPEGVVEEGISFMLYDLFGMTISLSCQKKETGYWILRPMGECSPGIYILKASLPNCIKNLTARVLLFD